METKIKATVYAKQLRAKLGELIKARPGKIGAHKRAQEKWRKEMVQWVRDHAADIVMKLPSTSRYNRWDAFDGAPKPPRARRRIKCTSRRSGRSSATSASRARST